MSAPFELTFDVAGTYDALWQLGGMIVKDKKGPSYAHWLLVFRDGLRGMLARIVLVDRQYVGLHEFQSAFDTRGDPNLWAVMCESHAGAIFFGMDSAIECFVYAMNALGYGLSPTGFCDISDARSLRQISPKNILGGDPADKRNPKPGYLAHFPGVVAHFRTHERLLADIFEYHDVSKHRSAVAFSGTKGALRVRSDPKQPGSLLSSNKHTVESLTQDFQKFFEGLLSIALVEGGSAYGYSFTPKIST